MYFGIDDEKEEVGRLVLEMLEQGCWTREDIFSNLRGELAELDDAGFNAVIDEQIVEKVKTEARYPETTDCDRFYRAFDALSEAGSLALHCPGSTFTSSYYWACQEWVRRGGVASGLKGTLFYDPQCVEYAINNFQLPIYFRAFPTEGEDPYAALKQSHSEFGKMVLQTMNSAGLQVVWDSPNSYGMDIKMNWQKRFDAKAFEVKSASTPV